MKGAFFKDGTERKSTRPAGRSAKRLSLAHAREQLGQAVGNVLAGSLEALGERLLAGLPQESASKAERRLREVVQGDRALRVARTKESPRQAPAQDTENRAEATVTDEPIRTRTMARLLAAQGYRKRALAIYDELIRQEPADTALLAERAALLAI